MLGKDTASLSGPLPVVCSGVSTASRFLSSTLLPNHRVRYELLEIRLRTNKVPMMIEIVDRYTGTNELA